jgi:hypothetical protein
MFEVEINFRQQHKKHAADKKPFEKWKVKFFLARRSFRALLSKILTASV